MDLLSLWLVCALSIVSLVYPSVSYSSSILELPLYGSLTNHNKKDDCSMIAPLEPTVETFPECRKSGVSIYARVYYCAELDPKFADTHVYSHANLSYSSAGWINMSTSKCIYIPKSQPPNCNLEPGHFQGFTYSSGSSIPDTLCHNSCEYQFSDQEIPVFDSGDGSWWVPYEVKADSSGGAASCSSPSPPQVEPEDIFEDEPSTPFADGNGCYVSVNGSRYCPESEENENLGCPNYFEIGGQKYCHKTSTPPDENEGGENEGGNNGDNNNNEGGNNGNGSDGGDGSNGSGSDGGSNNNGSGSTGDGNNGSNNNGDGDGEGTTAGGSCVADNIKTPTCSGVDAVQCGIYQEMWLANCLSNLREEWLYHSEDQGNELVDGEENEIVEEEVDFSDLLNTTQQTNLFTFSDTCPAPETFSIYGKNFEISYEPFCEFSTRGRPLIIALGYLLSALILLCYLRKGSE